MRSRNLVIMLETSLLVAAALLLSLLRLWRMPQGGGVTLEMLPIFILAFRRGGKVGVTGGALLGVLKLLLSPYILHPVQVLLDYPVPFAVLGVAGFGILRERRILGIFVGTLLRYVTHVIAGVAFFAEYAPEGTSPLVYSVTYNLPYLIAQVILVLIVIQLLSQRREIFEPEKE
ncbi:MAG: energy-coupled thiamine transporter ThiT [Firmicutes bacterium]|mgnify:CR=1 FL=1|nr:energy-coupled thiamine transporter ThiT [Bacillota bacterium]